MTEAIGWAAAAIFPLSYLVKRERDLVLIQLFAACVWIAYGVGMQSKPVIVANIVVASAASFKTWRISRAPQSQV